MFVLSDLIQVNFSYQLNFYVNKVQGNCFQGFFKIKKNEELKKTLDQLNLIES